MRSNLFWRGLALAGLSCGGVLLHAQTATEPPRVLPKVDVFGNVPIVKVGDFTMREARFAPAAVVAGDFIYIIGGQDTTRGAMTSIERFDPRTGTSEEFATLKTGRFWHRAVVVGEKIYVLGGNNGRAKGTPDDMFAPPSGDLMASRRVATTAPGTLRDSDALDTAEASVEIIDLATRQVSAGVPMPDARWLFACAALEDKIYVMGGRRPKPDGLVTTNDVQIFDVKRGKWSRGTAMPAPLDTSAAIVPGGLVVTAGGVGNEQPQNSVTVFSPAEKLWRILPPLHRGVSANSIVFLGHYLFLFGDYLSPNELVAYDLVTKHSESFTLDYKSARHTAAVVYDDKAYVIGGRMLRDSASLDYIQVYALRAKK